MSKRCRLTNQRNDNFAVGVCLEMVWGLKSLANDSVVVNLAIDGQGDAIILVGKRLRSTLCRM